MPVYNAQPYLDQAVESVLGQTYANFRFAIYDDHSTDGSYERALEWARRDPRIQVVRGLVRLGPCGSSNAAAGLANTELVARMDADDIAAPERLELQVAALRERPDAVLVGSTFEMIDGKGRTIRKATPGRILGQAPPFAHPSITYRKADFDAVGGYQPETEYFEDMALYRRLGSRGRLLVIAKPLMRMRFAGQHARMRDDRSDVLGKIDRLYHGVPLNGRARHLSVMAYYSVAVLAILNLQRPRMLGEMLRNASFDRPLRAASVLCMVAVAEVSPRMARALGHLVSDMREWFTAPKLGNGTLHEWSPFFPAEQQTVDMESFDGRRSVDSSLR